MTNQSRTVLAAASLSLVLMFVLPIWKISLDAPQYPEGLGMQIWINTITGEKPHDLQNINGLNHYIGMKRIVPDTIPELKIMPWFIGFMIVFGLVAAASGKPLLLWTWIAIFLCGAVVGLVDFYLWEYDYGHNLDAEKAIIKIPGMDYQPPLIGTKKLLNFTASSWPATGGWIAFLALGSVIVTAFRDMRRRRPSASAVAHGSRARKAVALAIGMIGLSAVLSACAPQPQPILYGEDQCSHCRMTILDTRYGAELVNRNGKVYRFDSVECLAGYLNANDVHEDQMHSIWVADFLNPGTLVDVSKATILQGENFQSPMGMNMAAFGPMLTHDQLVMAFGGEAIVWRRVRELVASRGTTVPVVVKPRVSR